MTDSLISFDKVEFFLWFAMNIHTTHGKCYLLLFSTHNFYFFRLA